MSLWVNENGTMKEIAVDKKDMSTIRFFASGLKFFTLPSTRNYFKPSELGITKAIKTQQKTNENKYVGTWYSPAEPSDIDPEYIFTIKRGKLPFKIPESCKYEISGSTYGNTGIYTSFSDWNRSTTLHGGGGSITSTHYSELAIRFVLEDGENYRIDAYCYYYSITEATALNTNMYAYSSFVIGSQPEVAGYACNVYNVDKYIIDAVDVIDYIPEDPGITL